MEVAALIEQHEGQIRLLKQIDHFEKQKMLVEQTLDVLHPNLIKTAIRYTGKIIKYDMIINKLKVSYKTR